MDSFAEEAEKPELLEIQIGIIYPQKKPVADIFSIGIKYQNLYPFLGFNVSKVIII
jgi:hypothetical protein